MNDLDLGLEVVSSQVNHCVTFDVRDRGLLPKDHQ